MPSAKKLRGKNKKKAKEQRRDAPAVDSRASAECNIREALLATNGAREKVISIVKNEASWIKVSLELDDDELSRLMDAGLLGALLFRMHHGFDEREEYVAILDGVIIEQSLTTWVDLLSTISRRAQAKKTKLIPQYLERFIPQPFYFGSDEEHDPKTWIALVFCKIVGRLMTCSTFYKTERLHRSALGGVLCVLATLEEVVDVGGSVTSLHPINDEERYPEDAIKLMDMREEFLKFTCKEMIRFHHQSVLAKRAALCELSKKIGANAVRYVRCILGYRTIRWQVNLGRVEDKRMLDIALLPTPPGKGSIFMRNIIAILRVRAINNTCDTDTDACYDIVRCLVIQSCVDEEIIQDLVYLARESNDWLSIQESALLQEGKANFIRVISLFQHLFSTAFKSQGSVERRVGVAVKAGLLDVMIGFLCIIAEKPQLQAMEFTEDALDASVAVLSQVERVANKKKARVAIMNCQADITGELISLRQRLQEYAECDIVLARLQSVLDEGTGPVARTCSECSRILGSGAIFRCERCGEVYCSPVCQKISWRAGHHSVCTDNRKKVYRTNPGMLEDHAKYMLGVWTNKGEEELVKAMEEALVFPRARSTVLTGCVNILYEMHDSNEWDQVRAMIIALYKSNLVSKVSKSDIDNGMKTFNLIRVCMEKMDHLFGRDFTREFFWEPHSQVLLGEFLGNPNLKVLYREFIVTKQKKKQRIKEGLQLAVTATGSMQSPSQTEGGVVPINKVAYQQDDKQPSGALCNDF
ncbi:hypothetical protein THAOC_32463, partial [Thalassiosira oceanica]